MKQDIIIVKFFGPTCINDPDNIRVDDPTWVAPTDV